MADSFNVLGNYWHAVATSDSVGSEISSIRLLQNDYVLWRSSDGRIVAALDRCTHCLLYTSPSPRDQRGSRMPSSA